MRLDKTKKNQTEIFRKVFDIQKTFTTEPKTRRRYNKHSIVKRRLVELRESFYPTVKVPYNVVLQRMTVDFGLADRVTILSYLGRLDTVLPTRVDHTVKYKHSGKVFSKQHIFRRLLKEKQGYLQRFNEGHLEQDDKGEVFIVWHHKVQIPLDLPLPESNEGLRLESGPKNFYISLKGVRANNHEELENDGGNVREIGERREREYIGRDINSESESNIQHQKVKVFGSGMRPQLSPLYTYDASRKN